MARTRALGELEELFTWRITRFTTTVSQRVAKEEYIGGLTE